MKKLKKSDVAETERIISVMIAVIIVFMLLSFFLQYFDIIVTDRTSVATVVLVIGSIVLLMFDVMNVVKSDRFYFSLFDVIILLSVLSLFVSTYFATNIELAVSGYDMAEEGVFVLLSYIVIAYSVSLIREDKNKKIIYWATTIYGLTQVVMGFFQVVIRLPILIEYSPNFANEMRAFGTVKNADPYGSFMAMLCCFEIGCIALADMKKKRILHSILGILHFVGIVLSGTRGAMLGLCVSVLVLIIWLLLKYKKNGDSLKVRKLLIGGISGFILLVVGIWLTDHFIGTQVIDRTIADIINGGIGEDRLKIWSLSIEKTIKGNVWTGAGVSNLYIAWIDTSKEGLIGSIFVNDAHNRFVNVFANQGIIGLIIYVGLLGFVLHKAIKTVRSHNNKYGIGLLLAFIAYTIADLFNVGMFSVVPFYYIIIGAIAQKKNSDD